MVKKHPDRTVEEYLQRKITLHTQMLKVEEWRLESLKEDLRRVQQQTTLMDVKI